MSPFGGAAEMELRHWAASESGTPAFGVCGATKGLPGGGIRLAQEQSSARFQRLDRQIERFFLLRFRKIMQYIDHQDRGRRRRWKGGDIADLKMSLLAYACTRPADRFFRGIDTEIGLGWTDAFRQSAVEQTGGETVPATEVQHAARRKSGVAAECGVDRIVAILATSEFPLENTGIEERCRRGIDPEGGLAFGRRTA